MNKIAKLALCATALTTVLATGNAFAGVTVTFTNPDNYADMPFSSSGKEEILNGLKAHFEKMGAQLPAGQDLKIEVLDVDLAGSLRPNARASQDFRVLTGGADWPMMKLRYNLESQGKIIKSGEERIADMDYLRHFNRYNSGETLRYEKQMLDDWFKKSVKTGS